ncbi:MAG: HEPN domain-containing protein [archaeon]
MDSESKLYLERANNEIKLADIIKILSQDRNMQLNIFKISEPETYFSAVITHSYYAIFYSAKAYLLQKGIKTKMPNEHRKTFREFRRFVKEGVLDKELLRIYEEVLVRAESLLSIFALEKGKRGRFTYEKLPQANMPPANESLNNASLFFKTISRVLVKLDAPKSY